MSPQALTVAAPQRVPLINIFGNRSEALTKDSKLVNCIAEKDLYTGDYWVEKRPGLAPYSTLSGTARGLYNWNDDIYAIFDTTLYKNGVSLGTVDATNGVYRFCQMLGSPNRLVLGNGVKAYYTDGTTLTQITDADFPTSFVKGWAYLDGTLYVMDSTAKILGSNLDDCTAWSSLNYLYARIEPDKGVALAKQQSYVIALKEWTTEVFYDAGNATGSPLGSVDGAKAPYGCAAADLLQSIDDQLIWVSTNRTVSPQVVMMEDLKVRVVSTVNVERLLTQVTFTNVASTTFKLAGHRYYVMTFKDENLTLVYDIDQDLWYQWTDANGNYWPIVYYTFTGTNQNIVQHETNGKIYLIEGDYVYCNDDGVVVPSEIVTPRYDQGIDRRKYLKIMRFNADQTPGSLLQVRCSDDDYQSWTQWRQVNLGTRRPVLRDCGTFYRRAWHFKHNSNTPFRINHIDLQIDIGSF